MLEIKNFTPHCITILGDALRVTEIPSSGIARVSSQLKFVDYFGDIPIMETSFGEVTGLPLPEEGVCFIVSSIVKSALSERTDLLVPSELIRDIDGNIIGCKSLSV